MDPSARGTADLDLDFPAAPAAESLTIIAGGLGAVGHMLHRELDGGLATLADIDPRQSDAGADIIHPGPLQQEQLRRAAIVVLAVPEPVAIEALAALMPLLRPDALLVETLSVKSRFADSLARVQPAFEVMGINPMFGPSLQMSGRAVAVVPYQVGERARSFTALIAEREALTTELSPSAHDQATVALQAMPHLLMLSYVHACAELDVDLDDIVGMAPPPANALLALAARIANGNSHVYSEIQAANPYAVAGRRSLAAALSHLSDACTSPRAFDAILQDVEHGLGDSREALLAAADRIVSR